MSRTSLFESFMNRIQALWTNRNPESVPAKNDSRREAELRAQADMGFDNSTTVYAWLAEQLRLSRERRKIIQDYEVMDNESPEISSALDIYADNTVEGDSESDEVITIKTDDPKVAEVLGDLKRRLKLDSLVWPIARSLAKYGEDFEEIVVNDRMEIVRLNFLHPEEMIRNENRRGEFPEDGPAFEQKDVSTDKTIAEFEPWQIIHFRLQKDRGSRYGTSSSPLHPVRKVYKQLSMMEDAVVIARLTRAHQRFVHIIDTANLNPDEARDHVKRVRREMRKRRMINPHTGKLDLDFNPLSIEEDIFIGAGENSRADVKVLGGDTNVGKLSDLEYFQNKQFAALKVPKAYLGMERDVNAKATLTQQDVQFARTVRRIQYAIQEGFRQLFDFALLLKGIDPASVKYTISLPVISTIDELIMWQIEQIRMQVANAFRVNFRASDEFVLRKFFDLTNEEIQEIIGSQEDDPDYDRFGRPRRTRPNEETDIEEDVTPEQLRWIAMNMRNELQALRDLVQWKLDKGSDVNAPIGRID